MKTLLCFMFLMTAGFVSAQSSVSQPDSVWLFRNGVKTRVAAPASTEMRKETDSTNSEYVYIYIDGIKVRVKTAFAREYLITEPEVTVITGGLPADYSNMRGSIIQVEKKEE